MAWQISGRPEPRTPAEQLAYCQGFRAGAGIAIDYMAEDKPLHKILDLAAMMEEAAGHDADPNWP
jgi:hypothetical protein